MIYIDRKKVPPPLILVDTTLESGGTHETKRAIAFYRKLKNRGKPFPYKAYSHEEVRTALRSLFYTKCAYCESVYAHVSPMDVEHWRPKGEVEKGSSRKIKPGYYWLAADWNNLLPSCIDCNRRRYQKVEGGNGTPVLLGKQNSFPLEPGSRRATKPGQEKKEKPLLLNPCMDRPLRFLEFATDTPDRRGIIRANALAKKRCRARAETSIQVYGLNRAELVVERKQRYIQIQTQIRRVKEAAARVESAVDHKTSERELEVYDREINLLLDYQNDTERYTLMARQLISIFLASHLAPVRTGTD